MKKKTTLVMIALASLLGGCGNSNSDASTKSLPAVVDCMEIQVMRNGKEYDWKKYETGESCVFEYSNQDDSKMVYIDYYYTYSNDANTEEIDSTLYVSDRGVSEKFYFNDFIGFLKYEVNYYLDVEKKMIDIETKWSLYDKKTDPYAVTVGKEKQIRPSDNELAFECAQKGYYTNINADPHSPSLTVHVDEMDGSLERHKYITYPDDCTFEYTPKWF